MRLLVWLCGVLVELDGLELALYARDGWRWVWAVLLVLWLLYGLVLALYHVVSGLMKRGAASALRFPLPPKGDK